MSPRTCPLRPTQALIGDDKAGFMAKKAHQEGSSLRDDAIASGHLTGPWMVPRSMVGNL